MANRGGNSRRAQQEDDNAITSVQCDGLVSYFYPQLPSRSQRKRFGWFFLELFAKIH